MEHVLDNPAWNALVTGNRRLALGNENARYFRADVSPFVGLKDNSADDFATLYNIIPEERIAIIVAPHEMSIPGNWDVLQCIEGVQMIADDVNFQLPATGTPIIPLTSEHIPQMLTLTKLTEPGPFASGTIEFGHYCGIFDGDNLVAMAGQRLHVFEYMEISAVCTHPDCLGRGYARQLLLHQVQRIKTSGGIPFLHARSDNERAINIYLNLGFRTRTKVYFHVIQKIQ